MTADSVASSPYAGISIPAADGFCLGARLYEHQGSQCCGSIVVSGAVGVEQSRYTELATFLA